MQSDARLNAVGGPSNYQADQIMQQVNDRAAGKHTFTKTTDDRSVFVSNLPRGENGYTTTHDDLANFFSECGQILALTLLSDRKTGQLKGTAYIEFATFEGHGRALDTKQNAMFNGNVLKVEKKRSLYRPPTAPAGGRGRGGAPGAGAGADAMGAMLAMMMAAAGKMMAGAGPTGGRGGAGRGRGGRGGGFGRGGNGGGFGNSNGAFGGGGSAFGGQAQDFGGGQNTGGGFGNSQAFN